MESAHILHVHILFVNYYFQLFLVDRHQTHSLLSGIDRALLFYLALFHLTSEEVKHSEDNDKDQENDKNDICYDTPVHVDTSSVFTFALYHRALPVNYTIAGIKAQA